MKKYIVKIENILELVELYEVELEASSVEGAEEEAVQLFEDGLLKPNFQELGDHISTKITTEETKE